jgi:coenzyme Q-binding protein COQ10
MARITKKILIHAPYLPTNPIMFDPNRWCDWYVGLSAPSRVNGTGDVGTVSEHTLLVAGHHYPVTHTVVERSNEDIPYWKGEFTGSLEGWHRWTYTPVNGGMEVAVEHEYTLPGALLGRIADRMFVERMIDRMLGHSLENLKTLCEEPVAA